MSHATEEAKRLVFLPDREERPFNIKVKIKLRVKVIPANEPSARFVVKKAEKEGSKKESEQGKEMKTVFLDVFKEAFEFKFGTGLF